MKKILLHTIALLSSLSLIAQSNLCGFVPDQAFMDRVGYLKTIAAGLDKTEALNDSLPLAIHLVANDQGNGRHKITQLFENICTLNEQYADAGIYFWIQWPINYIDNSSYYTHSGSAGFQMMSTHKRANALNLFFVNDPNGACGYYSYGPDCIAIAHNCAKDDNTTIAHELGHLLSLPHTFSGWEHGNTPTYPELVTRGAGANCNTAGDKFCDTDADYIDYRWNCPYYGTKYDLNGDLYHPDSSFYMSYSKDQCQARFSAQQIQNMRAEKAFRYAWLDKNFNSPVSNFPDVQLTSSFNDTIYNDKYFSWDPLPGANAYYVQFNFQSIPHYIYFDSIVETTHINAPVNFNQGTDYFVRVMPLNNSSLCGDLPDGIPFTYINSPNPLGPNSLQEIENSNLSYELSSRDQQISLHTHTDTHIRTELEIYNTVGQLLSRLPIDIQRGDQSQQLTVPQLSQGLYVARIRLGQRSISQLFVVH